MQSSRIYDCDRIYPLLQLSIPSSTVDAWCDVHCVVTLPSASTLMCWSDWRMETLSSGRSALYIIILQHHGFRGDQSIRTDLKPLTNLYSWVIFPPWSVIFFFALQRYDEIKASVMPIAVSRTLQADRRCHRLSRKPVLLISICASVARICTIAYVD
jgi:hypothetical protein